MEIQVGYELIYECPKATPMLLTLGAHHTRALDLLVADVMRVEPNVAIDSYRDSFGNWCSRLVAPAGRIKISALGILRDAGVPDPQVTRAIQHPVEGLPAGTLLYLLGSRYCETDKLSELAWQLFSNGPTGWARVQRICDFVHQHIKFSYAHADATRTAVQVYECPQGVCRDFAHLAITLCRCMNIPARYCTGYVSDIGIPGPRPPMDFAAWIEVFLSGRWHTFDPRNNAPRIGRILIARGRDAADVAITTAFGPNTLKSFRVWTDELLDGVPATH